jgi:hypothetical protein
MQTPPFGGFHRGATRNPDHPCAMREAMDGPILQKFFLTKFFIPSILTQTLKNSRVFSGAG